MDATFTHADLARLALSTRLRELAQACQEAVADGDPDLAKRLWSLLGDEVPRVQQAIVAQVLATGGSWADVAALDAQSEDEARNRWQDAEPARTEDPVATATELDAWYIRHSPVELRQDPFSRLLSDSTPRDNECVVCVKYRGGPYPAAGGYTDPPGGYLLDDGMWRVSHGPVSFWPAGTLLIESHRHFLDFAEMTDEEAAAIGPLIRRLTGPLKQATGAPRVHVWSCMEGAGHFHCWLVPRVGEVASGRAFIGNPGFSGWADAEAAIGRIREALG